MPRAFAFAVALLFFIVVGAPFTLGQVQNPFLGKWRHSIGSQLFVEEGVTCSTNGVVVFEFRDAGVFALTASATYDCDGPPFAPFDELPASVLLGSYDGAYSWNTATQTITMRFNGSALETGVGMWAYDFSSDEDRELLTLTPLANELTMTLHRVQ